VVGTSVVRDELSSGRLVALALSGRTLEKTYYVVRRLSDMAPDRTEGFVDFITRRV
jgi:DNA-binding transcriptional LysR family regulator